MTPNPDQTAILLFSRSAREEAQVKTFVKAGSLRRNQAVARSLIGHARSIARQSGLPLKVHFCADQVGDSFGERLANGIEALFSQGFARVIVLGNDCPALRATDLRQVDVQLQTDELVLGPAQDGGLYLIGIQQGAYAREAFIALAWEQTHLQQSLLLYAKQLDLVPRWLKPLSDVDDAHTLLHQLRQQAPLRFFWQQLRALILSFILPQLLLSERLPQYRLVRALRGRAPPWLT